MSERCPTCDHELIFYTDYPVIAVQGLEIIPLKEKQIIKFSNSQNRALYESSNSEAVRNYLQSIQERIGSDIKPSDLNPPFEEVPQHPSFFRIGQEARNALCIKPSESMNSGEIIIRLGYIYAPSRGGHAILEGATIARIRFEGKLNLPQ